MSIASILEIEEIKVLRRDEVYYKYQDVIDYFFSKEEIKYAEETLRKEGLNLYKFTLLLEPDKERDRYISTYGLLLLFMTIFNEKTSIYRRWMIKNTIERIREIENPDIGIDKANTLYFKKGSDTTFTFKRNQVFKPKDYGESILDTKLIKEDIINSENYHLNRQISE